MKQIYSKWMKRVVLLGIIPLIIITITAGTTFYYTLSFFKDMSAYYRTIDLPNSIDVLESVEIGGINQGISIRGHNKDAPILLYLHGGPGYNTIRFSHEFTGPWEEYFTVVVWDRRGSGKSYYTSAQIGDTMTVPQMLDDTAEMIEYLRKRFKQDKIFLMGHSWGSALGIQMAKQHPEWIYGYIGIGQIVNQAESRRLSYEYTLDLLRKKDDTAGIKELEDMAPYPDNSMPVEQYYKNWGVMQEYLNTLGIGDWHQKTDSTKYQLFMLSVLLRSHTISLSEIYCDLFSDDKPSMLPSLKEGVRQTNIPEQNGYEYEVPVFFILGQNDWVANHQLAIDYYEQIKAPHKDMLLLENSSHMMFVEEPGRIVNFLANDVLPYADQQARDKDIQ